MTNISLNNAIFSGFKDRKSTYDLEIPESFNGKLVIFCHGFMGYKDWGCWNLVQKYFVKLGFGFCKYNVSHNGGTVENPIDFTDLKAFSENTYSGELIDLSCLMEELHSKLTFPYHVYLIGHSRGGGTVLLTGKNQSVKAMATWAGISSIGDRFPKGMELTRWKNEGVRFITNGRTQQEMPMNFELYTDYLTHKDKLNIQEACENMSVPVLVLHGDKDTSVALSEGEALSSWLNTELVKINGADHTFCSAQPWKNSEMPNELQEVCEITADFFLIH